ncbi:ABC-2 type transport system ATP-binding protein [Micromonospora viridifaciens]|uniref:ABC-2 type transport system ATP-binding protein n=1 Tax=Micromonospora viridifaciens TaxID=1881 RepID=A0A1C4XTP0_MICVI|nr:ATP-binding cassette domain-containing protein [Micromonospora viridifaciens]SCF11762.1 ABC-2 type transport system ATP-binding protein [Micromonospora viridifaciens]
MTDDRLPIEVSHLTKRFGAVTAVHDLSFTVEPGHVTGFLGPNGAGKTTTMRILTGLMSPTAGTATIGGLAYRRLPQPSRTVGAVFDTTAFHPGHTARDHLRVYAAMGAHPDRRVDDLLDLLGLAPAADRRTRTFSTGMRQRLNLATALLGDPRVLLLDEPSNGLDPEGMSWLRQFLRDLAGDGRTVLVSSHVLSELEILADNVVVIRHGRLLAAGPWAQLTGPPTVVVRSPDADALHTALAGTHAERDGPDRLRIHGLDAPAVAELAARHRLRVHELTTERTGLEQLFLRLTAGEATTAEQVTTR